MRGREKNEVLLDGPLTEEVPAADHPGGARRQAAAYREHQVAGYADLQQLIVVRMLEVHRVDFHAGEPIGEARPRDPDRI